MIILHSYNAKENGEIVTKWVLFKTKNANYTKSIIEKVRDYLAKHVHPKYKEMSDVAIKNGYTIKYDDECLKLDKYGGEEWYELRDRTSFCLKETRHVTIVNID